jgi:hypothetical protein
MSFYIDPMQSVPITTNVVSSNPTQEIQHYVIKFVSDLRQVSGFLPVSSTNKTDCHDITEILLKHHEPANQPLIHDLFLMRCLLFYNSMQNSLS